MDLVLFMFCCLAAEKIIKRFGSSDASRKKDYLKPVTGSGKATTYLEFGHFPSIWVAGKQKKADFDLCPVKIQRSRQLSAF